MCELGGAGAGNTASMLHRDADLTSPRQLENHFSHRSFVSLLSRHGVDLHCTVLPKMWLQGSPVPVQ